MERCPTSSVIREMQIESTWGNTSYTLDTVYLYFESKNQKIKSTDKDVEMLEPHSLLTGMWNDAATLGNSVPVCQNAHRTSVIWPNNSTSGNTLKNIENMFTQKLGIVYNSQKVDTSKMFLNQ